MRLKSMLPTLLLAFALSIFVAVLAAARHSEIVVALAALLFSLQVLLVLLRFNVPLWRRGTSAPRSEWAWDNSLLAGISYAWGAAAMFTMYSLGGLVWRHWWQYGAGMLLLGAANVLVATYLVGRPTHDDTSGALRTLMLATLAQVAAVVIALIYLFASGKLATIKDDWAANIVFIAGGAMVLVISFVSLQTWRRLAGSEQTAA
jgi:hypothetical protein